MDYYNLLIRELVSIVSYKFMIIVLVVSLILLFWDAVRFKRLGQMKDYKIARLVGVIYLVFGIGLFIAGEVFVL